jgi:hypothetical protein
VTEQHEHQFPEMTDADLMDFQTLYAGLAKAEQAWTARNQEAR